MALNRKQERFVEEYLKDLNGTRAYLRSHPGVTDATARTEGSRLLAKPDIQIAIENGKAARSARTGVTQDKVLRELAIIAFSNLKDFAEWGANERASESPDDDGNAFLNFISLYPSKKLRRNARALAEVSEGKYGPKIRLHNKVRALEILLEHLPENPDPNQHKPANFIDLVMKAEAALKKKRKAGK